MAERAPLSLVLLTYVAPIGEVDAQLDAHVAWLRQALDNDLLLVGGRRKPRTGGVLVMRGDTDAVSTIAATDPFVTSGVATLEVVEFSANFVHPSLHDLIG